GSGTARLGRCSHNYAGSGWPWTGLGLAVDHPVALQAPGGFVLELAEQATLLAGDFPTQGVALQVHEQGAVPVDSVVLAEAVVVIIQHLAVGQGGRRILCGRQASERVV